MREIVILTNEHVILIYFNIHLFVTDTHDLKYH